MPNVHTYAIRLAVYYTALFAVIGVHMPWWPVWLKGQGLGAEEIGIVVAAGIGAKIIGNPLAAHLADRSGGRKGLMVLLGVASLASFALFALTNTFWPVLTLSIVFMLLWAPIIPLGESLAMLCVERTGIDYGRIRLWGSASFIAAVILSGWFLEGRSEGLIYWLLLGGLAIAAVTLFWLPDQRAPPTRGGFPVGSVLRDRRFTLFLLAAGFIQGSHGVYYAFGTLHWQAAGFGDDVIGWLWAEGVIAEILLFIVGTRLLRRLGPARLIMLGGLAGTLRWTVTGLTDAIEALVIVQALHAFTFGAAHLGAIHYIARAIPPELSATAQSLYSAIVMGLALGISTYAAGQIYDSHGGLAYLGMAAAGIVGTLLAFVLVRTELRGGEAKMQGKSITGSS